MHLSPFKQYGYVIFTDQRQNMTVFLPSRPKRKRWLSAFWRQCSRCLLDLLRAIKLIGLTLCCCAGPPRRRRQSPVPHLVTLDSCPLRLILYLHFWDHMYNWGQNHMAPPGGATSKGLDSRLEAPCVLSPAVCFFMRFLLVVCDFFSYISGAVMVGVILLSEKWNINPDNIATPIAASLGDVITLGVLSGFSYLFYSVYRTCVHKSFIANSE